MSYILITLMVLSGDFLSLQNAIREEFRAGHYAQAEVLVRSAIEAARADNDQYHEAVGYSALGDSLEGEGRFVEAEREFRKAISMLNAESGRNHAEAIVWRNLASDLTVQGHYREAREALKRASSLISKNSIHDPELTAEIWNSLGVVQFDQGEINKAEAAFARAASQPLDPDRVGGGGMWEIQNNIGHLAHLRRQDAKAEEAYKLALRLAENRLGSSHPDLARVHDNLGTFYFDTGRLADAEDQFRQSLAVLERADMSFDNTGLMHALYELARTYIAEHDEAAAQPLLERAAAIGRKQAATGASLEVAEIFDLYSKVLKNSSNASEAEHVQSEARKIRATMAFTVAVNSLH